MREICTSGSVRDEGGKQFIAARAYRVTISWIPKRVSGSERRLRNTRSLRLRPTTRFLSVMVVEAQSGQIRTLPPLP
jgi:hypothetical protein